MDAILNAIASVFAKSDNIALLASVAGNVGLGWLHVIWRREERADREKMLEAFNKNTECINGLRNVFSASIGKAL